LNLAPKEVIQLASESALDFAPGTRIRYSNTGYYLLGMLIERVSGKPYAQFLKERIFQPFRCAAQDATRQPKLFLIGRVGMSSKTVCSNNGAGKPNYYGLWWYITEHRGHRSVFHPGDKPGFSSTITRFEGDHLTVIPLCNTSTDSPACLSVVLSLGRLL